MAEFGPAYTIIAKNEGGYVNNPADTGGETFAGIARNYYPNWQGWPLVDQLNSTGQPLPSPYKTGHILIQYVMQHYAELWYKARANEINNQEVANIYFDFYVLHSKAVRATQEVLNDMGFAIAMDNIIGPQTIGALNQANPDEFIKRFIQKRIDMHTEQASLYPSQQVFLAGWIKRATSFGSPWEAVAKTSGIVGIVAIVGFFLIKAIKKQKK